MANDKSSSVVADVVREAREKRTGVLAADDARMSFARQLADEGHARDGQRPMPEQRADETGHLSAHVLVQRSKVTAGAMPLPIQVAIENDGPEAVHVATVELHVTPSAGVALPAALDLASHGRAGLLVEPDGEVMQSFTVSFAHPQCAPRAVTYRVGARVRFTDGRVIDAEAATIDVNPIIIQS